MQTTKLVGKETVAEGTMLFRFAKPEGFMHVAGQTVDLTLIDPKETDAEGNMRTFSIVASPQEDTIAIATRIRDTAFKRTLRDMPEGTGINVDGPFGSFTLHENAKRAAVFLSGGIGITPFHSIIKDATEKKLPHKLVLLYSNRRPEDTAFLAELQDLAKQNTNFTLVATMTDMAKSAQKWEGEQGYITADMVKKYVSDDTNPIYYLAGPPAMVAAMLKMLTESGVSKDDIRFEEFAGYGLLPKCYNVRMEEKRKEKSHRLQDAALSITGWVGSTQSIVVHTLAFIASFAAVFFGLLTFDRMLLVLTTIVSLEAIYLSIFIQMTINVTTKNLDEIQEDVEEIQEDMGEIQEDIDEMQEDVEEIQEDVDELQEDVEEMTEEESEEEASYAKEQRTLEQIHEGLQKLMQDVERLQSKQ